MRVRHATDLWLIGVMLALVSGIACAAGSWVAQARTPAVAQRGRHYATQPLKPRPTTPVVGRGVTSVSWRYGFASAVDPKLRVALCGGGRCIDATAGRGTSRAFAGLPVVTVFRFYFWVPGHGMRTKRLRGGSLQLVVNFD